jgi:hypothetical protein
MKQILPAVLFLIAMNAFAQKAVVLQHNGIATVFSTTNPLGDAYAAAVSGDTIYLPGGVFPGLGISKRLAIFGTGHYPDSTMATGVSNVASIEFQAGSDKSIIQGLNVGGISFQHNIRIDSVVVARCNAGTFYINGENNLATHCRGILIYQNVIGDMVLIHSSGVRVFNNIISGLHEMRTNTWIRNNKINGLYNCYYTLLENNTIASYASGIDFSSNNSTGNYTGVGSANILMNWTSSSYLYTDNYHLKTPLTHIGSDGTQVGIYGGLRPWKEGSLPLNPHIQSKTIADKTNTSGQIQVQVKVVAQSN